MNKLALIFVPVGYAIAYWSINILIQAYKRTGSMNPPTLAMCLGIPGAGTNPVAGAPNPVANTTLGDTKHANDEAVDPSALNPDGTFKRLGQP